MGLETESAIVGGIMVKCALLGDGMSGKTCMLNSYAKDIFHNEYTATVADEYEFSQLAGDNQIWLNVLDTAGQNDFEAFRSHIYTDIDVIILCFSVCDTGSFSNIFSFWLPEIRQRAKRKTPVILVGTQVDMRSHGVQWELSPENGVQTAKLIGAEAYLECSAKTNEGLDEVFGTAIECGLRRRRGRGSFLRRLFQR